MRRRVPATCLLIAVAMLALTGCERPAPELPSAAPSGATLIPPLPTQVAINPTAAGNPPAPTATRVAPPNPTTPSVNPPAASPTPKPAPTNTPAAPAQPPAQAFPYAVQAGDTLASIAAKFNTTVDVLKLLNNLDSDKITVGQQLIIPGAPPSTQQQPTPEPTAPPPPPPPPPSERAPSHRVTYVVKPGDRLFRIGLRYGVPWTAIARANGIVNPTLIQPGQVLVIPFDGGSPPSGRTYTVQAGDTLIGIALRHNTSVQAIMAANHLASTIIMPGQVLQIP